MSSKIKSLDEYISSVPAEQKIAFENLRNAIIQNLPSGFEETLNYGMIGYVVPHSIYPDGYHCDPSLPLPFVHIAYRKSGISLYHSGIYASPELHNWFVDEYKKRCDHKLDMGKSCIRWTKTKVIPYDLIGELMKKLTVDEWIKIYESRNT